MKLDHYARKKRQLKILAEKLQYKLVYQGYDVSNQIEKLIIKIKKLIEDLVNVLSLFDLKKILGTSAFLVGISITNHTAAQSFDPRQLNPFGLSTVGYYASPAFADLDNDGDYDLLIIGKDVNNTNVFYYFKNTGTLLNPQFNTPLLNPFGLEQPVGSYPSPAFTDLDGDGDLDLLIGDNDGLDPSNDKYLKYYENTGSLTNPQFALPQINPFGLIVEREDLPFPTFVDLDNDGDMDILTGNTYDPIKYFENIGSTSNPQFSAPQVNPFGLTDLDTYGYVHPAFADLDHDGDMDLIFTEFYGSMIYYENIGSANNPAFGSPSINPFGLQNINTIYPVPAFADIDNDGDQDLFIGEYKGGISYFKNTETSGINDAFQRYIIKMYPNPVINALNIESKEKIAEVKIFNILGEEVLSIQSKFNRIPLNNIKPGIYSIKIVFFNKDYIVRKIKIE